MNYNELYKAGRKACEEQMNKNEHKKGWDDIDVDYATYKIIQKGISELSKSVCTTRRDYSEIREKAADIANYAQMIILKCDKELKNETEKM